MSYANVIFSRFDLVLLQIVLQKAEITNQGKTVFAQIMSLIPRYEFDKCVKRYNGNRHAIAALMQRWWHSLPNILIKIFILYLLPSGKYSLRGNP